MRLKLIIIFLLFFGQMVSAQRILFNPAISFNALKSKTESVSFLNTNFSATYKKEITYSFEILLKKNNNSTFIFKFSNYHVAFSFKDATAKKNRISDLFSGGNVYGFSAPAYFAGIGYQRMAFESKKSKISLFGIACIGVNSKKDVFANSSGYVYPNVYIESIILDVYKKVYPLINMGIVYSLKNKKNKEIISLSTAIVFSPFTVATQRATYRYSGLVNPNNNLHTAIFKNKGTSIQFGVSKKLKLKN